jgi:hypothetical protein
MERITNVIQIFLNLQELNGIYTCIYNGMPRAKILEVSDLGNPL